MQKGLLLWHAGGCGQFVKSEMNLRVPRVQQIPDSQLSFLHHSSMIIDMVLLFFSMTTIVIFFINLDTVCHGKPFGVAMMACLCLLKSNRSHFIAQIVAIPLT